MGNIRDANQALPRRVCHITSVHIPFDTRIFYKECLSLAAAGYEVHLVAPHDARQTVHDVHIHPVPCRTGKLRRILLTPLDVYRTARRLNTDLYHFHDPELMPVGILLKLAGKQVIADVHEDYSDYIRYKEWIPRLFRTPLAKAVEMLERLTAGFYDAVVTVVPAIYERFASFHPRTVYVRNFPALEELAIPSAEVRNQNENEIPAVVYIGSLSRDRGLLEMVRAVELVNRTHPLRLILGGSFASPDTESEVRALDGFRFVDYRGFLDRKGVSRALGEASAGLVTLLPYPYYLESYSIKLFEYMSAGLPVVTSDFPRWHPMVSEIGSGLMVDPTNPSAIADAVIAILEDPVKAAIMGEHGRQAVTEKYNWKSEEASLLALYESLLG